MTEPIQVVCADSGDSTYVEPEYCPKADLWRATCCMCGAAEYREPEVI